MNAALKILVCITVSLIWMSSSSHAAIVGAEVISPTGASGLSVSGTLGSDDLDGDGEFDDLEVVQIIFTLDQQGLVTIDSDVEGFNSFMYLFTQYDPATGTYDDMYWNDNESRRELDSYLELSLAAGTHMVTLSVSGYTASDALQGYDASRPYAGINDAGANDLYGTWNLTLMTDDGPSEVPVPAALPLFFSALLGLRLLARRR